MGTGTTGPTERNEIDEPLKILTLTAPGDLTIGTHTVSFVIGTGAGEIPLPGAGTTEPATDYHILALVDPLNLIGENDDDDPGTSNNAAAFVGVYHVPGAGVYIHGSPASDDISVTVGRVRVEINGHTYVYQTDDVSNVVLRSHAGNDVIREESTSASLQVIGGRGDNELHWDSRGTLLDLPLSVASGLTGVAVIDLTGANPNQLRLDYSSVVDVSAEWLVPEDTLPSVEMRLQL